MTPSSSSSYYYRTLCKNGRALFVDQDFPILIILHRCLPPNTISLKIYFVICDTETQGLLMHM